MAFINQASALNVKSELDLFTTQPIQTTVESGTLQSYRPLTSLSNSNGPIEFVVSGSSNDEYLDLGRVFLHVQAKLTVPIPAVTLAVPNPVAPSIGPVNNWLNSMFSQVDVYLNQKCISPPNSCYPYKAYIQTLLNYGSDAKKSHLTTGIWAEDTPGHMNKVTIANAGFKTRQAFTIDDKTVDMYGPLHCDLFNVDKYMLSGVEMTVKLQRAKDSFHLMGVADSGATFEIIDAVLYVRKVKTNPAVLLAHHKTLSTATAKYPINRVDVKAITIPTGAQSKTIDNVYLGILPKRCIIGFVKTTAFNGSITENPFEFLPYNHTFLALYLDSLPIPQKPFTCDFANDQYIRAYNSLFEGTNINNADIGNNISREAYPKGYALVAVDLTPDLSASAAHISFEYKSRCA